MSKTLPNTVREAILGAHEGCDAGTLYALGKILLRLPQSLLDATVYGICPTCGGSRLVPEPTSLELDDDWLPVPESMEMVSCPDCTAVSVVTKELRREAALLLSAWQNAVQEFEGKSARAVPPSPLEIADRILSTVLGKTRTAIAVGRVVNGPHGLLVDCEDGVQRSVGDRIAIAILEDDDE